MLSASRQIATRRLDRFLASAEVTVSNISLRDSAGLTRFAPTQRARSHKTSRPSSRSFHGVRLKTSTLSFALLASERILNAMMSWTIVTQVQAEVQAASTVTPLDSDIKKTESINATSCHNQCEDQGGWDGLIFTLGMQGTLR